MDCNGLGPVLLFFVILIPSALSSKGIRDRCPTYELLYPCFCTSIPKQDERTNCSGVDIFTYRCQSPIVTCYGNGLTNYGQIFSKVVENNENVQFRKFDWFYLVDTGLKLFEENVFNEIYFKNIYIQNCPNLLSFHENAFGKNSSFYVENIYINASSLSDHYKFKRATFRALSSLRNLNALEIQSSAFTSLPYKAFIRNNNIKVIRFYNPDMRQNLEKIGSKAFYRANKVEEIDLKYNRISHISQHAFYFQNPSEHEVKVFLSGNSLHSDSFEVGAFLGSNGRNLTLYLGDYDACNVQLRTLRREVFEPFLLENRGNVIDMYGCPLVCDRHLRWLTDNISLYQHQVRNLICYSLSQFNNRDSYNYYPQ